MLHVIRVSVANRDSKLFLQRKCIVNSIKIYIFSFLFFINTYVYLLFYIFSHYQKIARSEKSKVYAIHFGIFVQIV